jgi:hypothetical protein
LFVDRSICPYLWTRDIGRKDLTMDDTAKVIEHYGTGNLTVKLEAARREKCVSILRPCWTGRN